MWELREFSIVGSGRLSRLWDYTKEYALAQFFVMHYLVIHSRLSTAVEESPWSLALSYHLKLLSVEGSQSHLEGDELIDSKIAFSARKPWEATTTINVTNTRLDETKIAVRNLHISLLDFRKQRTFQTTEDAQFGYFLLSWSLSFTRWVFLFSSLCIPILFSDVDQGHRLFKAPSNSYRITASDGM